MIRVVTAEVKKTTVKVHSEIVWHAGHVSAWMLTLHTARQTLIKVVYDEPFTAHD